ncbi:hypothetical protein MHTCC0001_19070 [Flavobacteriaceae bacterium MHTCC 0001]
MTYSETFKQDFGDIKGLFFMFDGSGYIDEVKLTDDKGVVALEDSFEG